MKRILLSAGAALVALSTSAAAATFTLSDTSTPGTIPGGGETNEILAAFGQSAATGFFGTEVGVTGADSGTFVTAMFIGFEAGFNNTFTFGDGSFSTGAVPGSNSFFGMAGATLTDTSITDGALLDFTIGTSGGGTTAAQTVDNSVVGDNPDNSSNTANYFVSFVQGRSDALYLFFDDSGAGNDDNHDDLVVLLTIGAIPDDGGGLPPSVPLPAGGLLLLGGLGVLAAARRRT